MQASQVVARGRTFGIAAAMLWATLAVVAAQGTTGSIAGFVTDESKAALPGATVTVKQVDTGQARVLTSDGQGRYRGDALTPGKYAVTVELSGFRTAQYDDVTLSVGQAAVLNVQLQIGGVTERVVVTGDATLAATRQSSVTALVEQSQSEGFNVTNHVNFGLPAATVFNSAGLVSTVGQITSIVGTARQFQVGVKVEF